MLPYLLQKMNQKAKPNQLKSWFALFVIIRNQGFPYYSCRSPNIINEVYNNPAGGHSFVFSFSFALNPHFHLQFLDTYRHNNGIFRQIKACPTRGPPVRF